LDGVDPATEKRWIHHYAFPGFSVGEVKPQRGAGRREIGHGALAERAIAASLPSKEEFPYTLRVNSEVLESNGSTSMASTCATSMALLDAGVPLKTPIGGIAMGLIKEGDQFVVLSDIQGVEDFLGDMDFKVTGSETGVTALQMDIKIRGISLEIMKTALEQARVGRIHILGKMAEAISTPRTTLSKYAPRILTLRIETDQIGTVIGPGGKMIRSIIEQTGATIDIEDSGLVTITSVGEGGEKAKEIIEKLTLKVERGMIMPGKVVRIIPIGAFVELAPGKDGMVHISQIAHRRVEKVEDCLSVGDEVLVKVADIDDRGRINLTIKGVSNEERAQHGFPPHEDKRSDKKLEEAAP
jgi:polyribonucleotide nucleotidyltransferase